MSSRHKKTADCCITALFCVIITVASWVCVPLPFGVQITLQTFAVALCGFCLGVGRSAAALTVYVVLGALGVPVFSGFGAGVGIIAGPTGGFIVGFFAVAVCCGAAEKCKMHAFRKILPFLGLLACHIAGVLWFSGVTKNGILQSALVGSLPFILKDVLSVYAAIYTAKIIRKRISTIY